MSLMIYLILLKWIILRISILYRNWSIRIFYLLDPHIIFRYLNNCLKCFYWLSIFIRKPILLLSILFLHHNILIFNQTTKIYLFIWILALIINLKVYFKRIPLIFKFKLISWILYFIILINENIKISYSIKSSFPYFRFILLM